MEFKAIALDMDGTLLNAENTIDDDLAEFLQKIRATGVKIFLASGRSSVEIEEVLPKGFQFDGMVSANGMGVYAKEEKIVQHAIDPAVITEAIDEARKMGLYYELHPLEGSRFALASDKEILLAEIHDEQPETVLDNEWNSRQEAVEHFIEWKDHLEVRDIIKVYFFSKSQVLLSDWMEKLADMKRRYSFSTSSSSAHNVEIMVDGVDKGTGVELLLEAYDIDAEDLLAVGDAENDLPMFEIAGMAVAMANAQHHVKAEVDDITDFPYDEGGLLEYLEQHFDV